MTTNENSQTDGFLNMDKYELKERKLDECLNELKNEFRAEIKDLRNSQSEVEKSLSKLNFESRSQSKPNEERNKVVLHSKSRPLTIAGSYLIDSHKFCKFQQQRLGKDGANCTWKIADVRKCLKEKNWELASQEIPLTNHPYNAQVGLKITKAGLKCKFIFADFRKTGEIIPFKLLPDISFTLNAHSNTKNGKPILGRRYTNNSPFNTVFKYDETACKRLIEKERLLQPDYNVDDVVSISVSVGPLSKARQTKSFDGTLRWVFEMYECIMKERFCHQSPYFYTSPCGYRVIVSLSKDVFFSCKYLIATVAFVTGEFDEGLPTRFHHQTTLTIYNGNDLSQSLTVKVKKNVKINKSYVFDVCQLETADKFVYNDQLIYKITIEELFS